MSKIYIDPIPANSVLDEEASLVQKLNTLTMELDNIRRNLRYKIAAQEKISAHLLEVGSQISKQKTAVNALKEGLAEIIAQYKKAERVNLQRLVASTAGCTETLYHRPSGQELLDVSQNEKDKFISEFEQEHPELAKIFDKFLSGGKHNVLTKDDIRNMKYLSYNANEPFRTIFLNSLSKFSIGDGNMKNNKDKSSDAFYRQFFHTVNYTYDENNSILTSDSFGNDPRGSYTVFFHECGHATDDLSDVSKWWGSDTEKFTAYSDSIGRDVTLREAIEYDVYLNKNNPHSMVSIAEKIRESDILGSKGDIEKVIRAYQSGQDPETLNSDDRSLYYAVRDEFQERICGSGQYNSRQYEAVTDVYGGMSHNDLIKAEYEAPDGKKYDSIIGMGHKDDYWVDDTKAAKELWAEYFSYNMSGSMENLEHLLEYFPEAAKVMEQYVNALGAQY